MVPRATPSSACTLYPVRHHGMGRRSTGVAVVVGLLSITPGVGCGGESSTSGSASNLHFTAPPGLTAPTRSTPATTSATPPSARSGSSSASTASRARTCAEYRQAVNDFKQGLFAVIKALNGPEDELHEAHASLASTDAKLQAIVLRLEQEDPADREALAKDAVGLGETEKAEEKAAAGNEAGASQALNELERTASSKNGDAANHLCGVNIH